MKPLGSKKSVSDNAVWWAAWDEARDRWPDSRLDPLVEKTLVDMSTTLQHQRWGFGWSGGKDAQALAWLCDQIDPDAGSVLSTHDLNFPAMNEFHAENLPGGCTVVETGHDLPWLAKYPNRLLPDSQTHSDTMRGTNQRGQEMAFHANGWDMLVTGRRRRDGSYTGPKGTNTYSNKRGVTRYSPMQEWSHEAVMSLLQREEIPLAPCYYWPHGFLNGTEGWPFRSGPMTDLQKLDEIHAIDSTILPKAAPYVLGIQAYVERRGI